MKIGRNHKRMSTHMLTLMKAIKATTGDICEVGAGFYSTPLIHWFGLGRNIVTYESHPDYIHYAKKFRTDNHKVRETVDFSDMDFDRKWSMVFIDHTSDKCINPHKRGDDAIKFKKADLIVMHDTECETEYGYDKVFPHFKYRYDWKENKPWASIVSNTIDVTKW